MFMRKGSEIRGERYRPDECLEVAGGAGEGIEAHAGEGIVDCLHAAHLWVVVAGIVHVAVDGVVAEGVSSLRGDTSHDMRTKREASTKARIPEGGPLGCL